MYSDPSGRNATVINPSMLEKLYAAILPTIVATGTSLNPGVIAVIVTVVVVVAIAYASEEGVCDAKALMDYASNATSPPPPNKGGKGTQVTSKTLYNKGGKKRLERG